MPYDGDLQKFTETAPAKYDLVNRPTDRLRYLADFMEGLRDDQVWMPGYDNGCGTAHCALGWAVTLPAFRALGCPVRSVDLHCDPEFFGIFAFEGAHIWMAGSYDYPEDEIPAAAVVERLREAAGCYLQQRPSRQPQTRARGLRKG